MEIWPVTLKIVVTGGYHTCGEGGEGVCLLASNTHSMGMNIILLHLYTSHQSAVTLIFIDCTVRY